MMAGRDSRELDAGTRLGNYAIVRKLGEGGVGTVYLARHRVVNQDAVLKVHDRLPKDGDVRDAFSRAANYLSQLNHPNIVKLYDYGFRGDLAFQAMEYVPGSTLADLMPSNQTKAWVDRVVAILLQLVVALRYAHGCRYRDLDNTDRMGITHGDVKPQNILVTNSDEVKLTDFMVPDVQRYLVERRTLPAWTTAAFGTPGYMPPEQERDKMDSRSDIYSVGQTTFEMLTGRLGVREGLHTWAVPGFSTLGASPIEGSPRSLNPYVEPWLDELVLKAIEPKPEDRFQTIADVERVLRENVASDNPVLKVKELLMGDRINITTGNVSGQVFMGKFHDVAAALEKQGDQELADALKLLKEAVVASAVLTDEQKGENITVITQLGEEASKDEPNRTLLRVLADGLLAGLRVVPDVAAAVTATAAVLARF